MKHIASDVQAASGELSSRGQASGDVSSGDVSFGDVSCGEVSEPVLGEMAGGWVSGSYFPLNDSKKMCSYLVEDVK